MSSNSVGTRKSSLRYWLGTRFVLVAAMPLLVVAILVWHGMLPQLREDVGSRHEALAQAISGQVSAHLAGATRELVSLAQHIQTPDRPGVERMTGLLDGHVGAGDMFDAIYLLGRDDAITRIGLPKVRRAMRSDLLGLDLSRRAFVRRARARTADTWSESFQSTVTGRLAVALTIHTGDELLVGEVAIDQLSSFIGRLPVQSGVATLILDSQGVIVADSLGKRLGERVDRATLDMADSARTSGVSTRDFQMEGGTFIGTAVRVPTVAWTVLVAQPTRLAFKPITTTLVLLAVGGGGALLLAIGAAWLLSRGIARRFTHHTDQARAIAQGDYRRDWPESGIREFADLAMSLRGMSDAIRGREEALRRNEARFHSIVSNAPVLIFEFDEAGRFTLNEGRGLEALGLAPGQLVGASVRDFLRDTPEADEQVRQAIAGRPREFTAHFGELLFETHLNPVLDAQDHCASVVGVAVDVTARKRVEEKLWETSEELERFFEASPEMLCIADAEGHFLRLNPEWRTVLGYELDELLHRRFWDFVHPDDIAPTLAVAGSAVDRDAVRDFVNRYRRKDGDYRWLEWRSFPFGDRVYASARDITDRLRAEAGLKESEQKFRGIVRNAHAIVFILDEQANFLLSEGRGLAGLGLAPGQVVGQSALVLYASYPSVLEGIHRAMAGESIRVTNELAGKVYDTVYSPYLDDTGRIKGVVGIAIDITERRQAEEALRLTQFVVDQARDAVYWIDADARIVYVNEAACRILGYGREELLELTVFDIDPGFPRARWAEHWERTMANETCLLETTHRTKDGRAFPVEISISVVRKHGRTLHCAFARDISERKQGELALRESQRQLLDIIDFLPDATFAIDAQGRVIAWNRAVEKMTGVAKAEMLGRGDHAYAVPFYGEARPALLDMVLAGATDLEKKYNFVRREADSLFAEVFDPYLYDGKGAYLWATASPLFDSDGKVVGAIESVRDITESKRVQDQIARAYGESRAITQAVRDSLYMFDLAGRLLWWNKHLEEVTGLAPETLRGRPYLEFFAEEDLAKAEASLREAVAAGFSEMEARIKTGSGLVPYHYHSVIVRDEQGEIIGVAGVGRDISEQVRNREKLRLSAAVLESTREGIMVTDADGMLISVNQAFTEITGFSEAEALGKHPRMLHSGRQKRDFYQALWASIVATGHWKGEIWNRHRSGKVYPEWLTISAVRNSEGEVTNYVGVFSDISHLKQSEAKLEHLAHYDPLTDLPNRLLLTSRLSHAIDQAERGHTRLAILFLDLDHFKHVNDSLGHPAGDDLLQAISNRLKTRIRDGDTLARLGGDEFVVVLEALHRPDEAAMVAHSIIELLEAPFDLPGDHEIYIGASIGISLYPDNGADATQLIRNADTAMYLAKSQGRNTYRYYTEALTTAANERLLMESRLRRALDRGEFVLHYQPQIAIPGGHVIGVEALLRWQHPEEGLIPPLRFIPLAEETGLIQPIGRWVLRTACAQLRAWVDAGLPPLTMAVNLSPKQFAQPDLVEQVCEALELTGLPPEHLELEITESAIMESGEKARTTLKALKNLGIMLSIDDFGTGYSSLAYLKQLPIDKLKIDKSFVDGIPHDRNDTAITTTIIAMAKNLNLRVLAEGVETEAQRLFLSEPGCDAYQGYLFSRPIPAAEIAALAPQAFYPLSETAMT